MDDWPERYTQPVVIAHADARWQTIASRLIDTILGALEDRPAIEHIGSTSIPGLDAKPIIDLLGGVPTLDTLPDRWLPRLARLGFAYRPEFEDAMPERRYFTRPDGAHGMACNFHVVVGGSPFWRRHLAFRDYLRAHDDERDAYAALKHELAIRHRHNRGAYTDAKTEFIQRIEHAARSWSPRSGSP